MVTGEQADVRPALGAVVGTASPAHESTENGSELLRAALTYAARGWFVFPVHTPAEGGCSCRHAECRDVGKHPRTMHGLKDASTDEAQIRKWWTMWPDANIGIATGPSRLGVIDIDPRHGGDETAYDLDRKHGSTWRDTATVLTGGGGEHYFYQGPGVRTQSNVAPGIDVRGEGGYVVAPPSLHESGNAYTWERTVNDTPLANYPVDLFRQRARAFHASNARSDVPIPSGERNVELTRMAGAMRRRGMGEPSILAALMAENAARCDPPLPSRDVERIARSVSRYDPADEVLERLKSDAPTYSHLRKVLTDPPEWLLRIGETDIRLTIDQLITHGALRKAALSQADIVLERMAGIEWDNQLAALVAEMQEVDAPTDASEVGVAWDVLRDVLNTRSDEEEQFKRGRPIERDGCVLVTGAMLKSALHTVNVKIEQRRLWALVREHGGESKPVRISDAVYRAWTIPLEALT